MADLHISPYESKEVNAAKASYAQGRLKVLIFIKWKFKNVKNVKMEMILFLHQVDRMEKQLQCLTDSAMSYKSIYSKSAAQMAREAMEVVDVFLFFCPFL